MKCLLESANNNDSFLYLINEKHLIVDETKVLGEGSFGKVYSGMYFESPVAVKIFEENTDINELDKEAKILMYIPEHQRFNHFLRLLRHPNIVSCIAYDTVQPRIITEKMSYR